MVQTARFGGSTRSRAKLALPFKIVAGPLVCDARSVRYDRVATDAKAPWVCRNIPARRLSGAHLVPERCELTKGPGAPERITRMEAKNPALAAGFRCAHRLHPVLLRQGRARTLRAVFDLHGPLLCRPLETLGIHRTGVRSRHHRARRPDHDAGAGGAGISRNRRRRLAEEIRARGNVPRPLRQSN